MPKCRRFIACYNIILYCIYGISAIAAAAVAAAAAIAVAAFAALCVLVRLCFIFPLLLFVHLRLCSLDEQTEEKKSDQYA